MYKISKLVLRNSIWCRFPDDDSLWAGICTNNQCYIIISISRAGHCAFCWLSVVNWLRATQGTKYLKSVCVFGRRLCAGYYCRKFRSLAVAAIYLKISVKYGAQKLNFDIWVQMSEVWYLRFSLRWQWRLPSSWMRRRIVSNKFTDFSEKTCCFHLQRRWLRQQFQQKSL